LESLCIAILISNYQKCSVFLITAYVFSSTKVEKRAEQVLSGSERSEGEREWAGGQREEMAQTMYAYMNNKRKKKRKKNC
jgi:hypothetical protein